MSTENTRQVNPEALSPAAIARRHALLKGLSRGSVVLAVATPIRTLAASTSLIKRLDTENGKDGYRGCSISGMHSLAPEKSIKPGTTYCSGKSPGYWGNHLTSWPTLPKLVPPVPPAVMFTRCELTTKLGIVFPTSPNKNETLQRVSEPAHNFGDDFHWLSAWLNALASEQGMAGVSNFPYTAEQIRANYGNANVFELIKYLEI